MNATGYDDKCKTVEMFVIYTIQTGEYFRRLQETIRIWIMFLFGLHFNYSEETRMVKRKVLSRIKLKMNYLTARVKRCSIIIGLIDAAQKIYHASGGYRPCSVCNATHLKKNEKG